MNEREFADEEGEEEVVEEEEGMEMRIDSGGYDDGVWELPEQKEEVS